MLEPPTSPRPLRVEWLGRRPYLEVQEEMKALLLRRIAGDAPDTLLLVEHQPTFTVGRRRGAMASVKNPGEVPVVEVARGGDVTFHGPGQLTAYPICALPPHRHDLHAWMHGLEGVVDGVLARWDIKGERDERNTGVWVDGKKIAAVGIACKRWVTWHGVALNIKVNLDYYGRIDPCGMDSSLVTRMADHVSRCPTVRDTARAFSTEFRRWWMDWSKPPP
ncbi:MAG: lipoyl(octanoyl) transferase [Deltaproteobacteria bacterium]|nr:lipoyl(octanoyl) transferase [Deltaproteobacteria bacterium]HCH62466.1 lipoyl(octanoyl) transferase [Deltaproteobacteria bacterium]